jgi:ssDNA-binding Zn-finger/Zn-ribbon topoisomerase 1
MLAAIRAWLERRRRFARALAFNRISTYTGPSPVGGQWSCPTCNQVHDCMYSNSISGRQFPGCCDFPAGSRTDKQFATGL